MGNDTSGRPERRQTVRMNDKVLFHYGPVSPERYKAVAEDFRKGIPPHHQDGLQDIQMHFGAQSALSRLRERDQDLAFLLQHLDRKLDLLLKEIQKGEVWSDKLRLQEVSLSGGGIGFWADESLSPGQILELHIVLLPQSLYIYTFVEVVDCCRATERGYRTCTRFLILTEDDHENLVQHTFRLQSLALRNRRLEK